MRKIYFLKTTIFYSQNKVQSLDELEWILKRSIILTKCHLAFDFEGTRHLSIYHSFYTYSICTYNTTVFSDEYNHASLYERIAVRCPNLTEVIAKRIDDQGLLALSMVTYSTLTDLSIRHGVITDGAVDRLCKGCPYLTRVSLGFWNDLTDASVRSIVKYCPGIEHLSLGGWTKITDEAMMALLGLKLLKEIDLSDCSGLTSAGVQGMLRSAGANLEVLTLSVGSDYDECEFCDDALLRCLGVCCPKLRDFCTSVGLNTNITEATLVALVRGCPQLENFQVFCNKVSEAVWVNLAVSCPRLAKLDLSYVDITDIGFNALSRQCKQLTSISLHDGTYMTPKSFTTNLMHCNGLKELDLHSISWLSDQSLSSVLGSMPLLTEVKLSCLPLITDRSILVLMRSCPKVKQLWLFFLTGVTDRSIATFVTLEELDTLSISSCPSLTDHTIRSLACHCKKLNYVNLTNCSLVTEQGVIDMLTEGERLTYISITSCNVIHTTELDEHLQRRSSSRRLKVDLSELGCFTL